MRLDRNELSKAVRMALSLGAVAAVGAVGTAQAQDQTASQGQTNTPQTLQTIVVTGSHIRRVDLETSNPVVTVDAAQIQKAGAVTVGDLIQQLPAVTGSPQNTRVNNGGGSGGTFANLRGLGTGRTLVLVDGHRVLDNDLNRIPVEMIERVEVLTDGGAVTYGSDAIGGVINFILKKNYQGAQATLDYGISDRDDAERRGASFIFGQTSDKGSILAGVDYNKFDPVFAGNRNFSKDALYLYYGNVYAFGSSRTPQPNAYLQTSVVDSTKVSHPETAPGVVGTSLEGCNNAIGTSGDGSSVSDYKCYSGADAYNYQVLNYDLTPQERLNAFFKGEYQLTDNVKAYMDVFHNKTTSNSAIAPLPFDANSDLVTISRYSMYNPFGVDFGPPTDANAVTVTNANDGTETLDAQYNYRTRFTGAGQRKGEFGRNSDQGLFGLSGSFGQSSWQWDVNYNYGHIGTIVKTVGDLVYSQAFRNAVGPSMLVDGVPTCVSVPNDPTTAISGCVPYNIFDQADPAQAAILAPYQAVFFSNTLTTQRSYNASVNGTLATLPAGDMQLAVGADYRKDYSHTEVSYLTQIDQDPNSPGFGGCQAPQSACTSALAGGFTTKEAYAELFIPVLKDLPFVRSLNVSLGDRYSKYSLAGSTNNTKIAVEWRPIDDVLLRGTVQDVFRAPTIGQLFTPPTGNAPTFNDPCINLTSSELAAHANACQNVGPGASFQQLQGGLAQTTGVISGSEFAGYPLKPEFGKSFDWGVVYDPHFVPGLSLSADVWRVYLNDTITTLGAQTAANICFANDASPFCSFLHRQANGVVHYIDQPTVNLGRLDTKGVDAQVSYRIPQMRWLPGQFTFWLQGTYLSEYTDDLAPGTVGDQVEHVAGHFYKDFGSFPRVRGNLGLNWNMGPWEASWRTQYIGHEQVGSWDPNENENADSGAMLYSFRVPDIIYNYLEVGYNIEPLNTKIQFGVDNVFDKQPPIFTQSNTLNGDTDVNTYDTIGRFYWARATIKF